MRQESTSDTFDVNRYLLRRAPFLARHSGTRTAAAMGDGADGAGYCAALAEEFRGLRSKARLRMSPEECLALLRSDVLQQRTWLALKAFLGAYAFAVLLWSLCSSGLNGARTIGFWPIYLTNWTLALETLYLFGSMIAAFMSAGKTKDSLSSGQLCMAHVLAFLRNVVMPGSLAVVIMYWALVYEGGNPRPLPVHAHGATGAFMSLDIAFVAAPYRIAQSWCLFAYGVAYILFSVIYFLCGGRDESGNRYVYNALDYSNPGPTAITVIIQFVIVLPVCILVSWHIRWLSTRFFPQHNTKTPRLMPSDGDENL